VKLLENKLPKTFMSTGPFGIVGSKALVWRPNIASKADNPTVGEISSSGRAICPHLIL